MDKTVNDPIEQRVKTLELKVEFLENWKNAPFIQVTLPVILSIFLATSWNHFAFTSFEKRLDTIENRMSKLEGRMDNLEGRIDKLEIKIEKVLVEITSLKS